MNVRRWLECVSGSKCVCGGGGLLAPVARARRKWQHRGCHGTMEEMLSPLQSSPHFIHQSLARAIFSPPLALHLCRPRRVSLSLRSASSPTPPSPPPPPSSGRALYKQARDSASSLPLLQIVFLRLKTAVMIAFSHSIVKQTKKEKGKEGRRKGKKGERAAAVRRGPFCGRLLGIWIACQAKGDFPARRQGTMELFWQGGVMQSKGTILSDAAQSLRCPDSSLGSLRHIATSTHTRTHTRDVAHVNYSLVVRIKCKLRAQTEGNWVDVNDTTVKCVLKMSFGKYQSKGKKSDNMESLFVYKWCWQCVWHRHTSSLIFFFLSLCLLPECFAEVWNIPLCLHDRIHFICIRGIFTPRDWWMIPGFQSKSWFNFYMVPTSCEFLSFKLTWLFFFSLFFFLRCTL